MEKEGVMITYEKGGKVVSINDGAFTLFVGADGAYSQKGDAKLKKKALEVLENGVPEVEITVT